MTMMVILKSFCKGWRRLRKTVTQMAVINSKLHHEIDVMAIFRAFFSLPLMGFGHLLYNRGTVNLFWNTSCVGMEQKKLTTKIDNVSSNVK